MADKIHDCLAVWQCPDCGGGDFRNGPRGGLAQNVECRRCKGRFNVTWYGGELVFAERIPKESEGGGAWREDMFPKVLQ